jgi:hypothetical protein
MSTVQIQEYLFQRIKESLPGNESLAEVVGGLLFVSPDSAYRRIRGETPLVLEEARILCDAFGISLDELLKAKPNSVSFTAIQVNNDNYGFESYLKGILSNLKFLCSAEKKEILYLTKDIPVFYNFLFRPLFAFRYFFWMKSILQHPDFISKQFSIDMLTKELEDIGGEINQLYQSIPSTEIWNTECVNSTISQIEYYREAGYFRRDEDIDIIYDALRQLVEHIRQQADNGCKFLPGQNIHSKKENFRFFYNRVVLGDNTIMAFMDGKKILYLSYDVLNYMVTQDEALCNDVYAKMQMLMQKATILSNVSEKQRNMFFNTLLRKIPGPSTNHSPY